MGSKSLQIAAPETAALPTQRLFPVPKFDVFKPSETAMKSPSNGHGGARPGSGPKAKPKLPRAIDGLGAEATPLDFLLTQMRDPHATTAQRIRAAIGALPYCHGRIAVGKKVDRAEAARAATDGKFKPHQAPTLVVRNT
jgi:hypothetical protein